jgi:hypothetical protein
VAEGVRLVRGARGAPEAVGAGDEHLVAGVDEGMHGLAEHPRKLPVDGGGANFVAATRRLPISAA